LLLHGLCFSGEMRVAAKEEEGEDAEA